MKPVSIAAVASLAALCAAQTFAAQSLGTAFTYQGRLNDGGVLSTDNPQTLL